MIEKSINLKVSRNTKPKELKQNRKTRIRYYVPEGGEITFDFFDFFWCVCVISLFFFCFTTWFDSFHGN